MDRVVLNCRLRRLGPWPGFFLLARLSLCRRSPFDRVDCRILQAGRRLSRFSRLFVGRLLAERCIDLRLGQSHRDLVDLLQPFDLRIAVVVGLNVLARLLELDDFVLDLFVGLRSHDFNHRLNRVGRVGQVAVSIDDLHVDRLAEHHAAQCFLERTVGDRQQSVADDRHLVQQLAIELLVGGLLVDVHDFDGVVPFDF
ncbi:MAG: hypothetical protein FD138_4350, partial [Planctomycetota bacterium]